MRSQQALPLCMTLQLQNRKHMKMDTLDRAQKQFDQGNQNFPPMRAPAAPPHI
jgi:hypothetical protein